MFVESIVAREFKTALGRIDEDPTGEPGTPGRGRELFAGRFDRNAPPLKFEALYPVLAGNPMNGLKKVVEKHPGATRRRNVDEKWLRGRTFFALGADESSSAVVREVARTAVRRADATSASLACGT